MSNVTDIFQYAVRNKLRFVSAKGQLTTEQLWDVPLRSGDGFNLDAVARTANTALKEATEESFVSTEQKPEATRLKVALEVVKLVINTKLEEEAAAKRASENRAEKAKLLKILAEKQDGKLERLSEAELRRRIEALE